MYMDYREPYVRFLKRFLHLRGNLTVVFDSSDGATGFILKDLVRNNPSLKAFFLNARPNGAFPAHGPNPLLKGATRELCRTVRVHGADLGVIFDADGDRVFFADNRGCLLGPDQAAILVGKNFRGPVIFDIRSGGYLAREWFNTQHRQIVETKAGHFFIKQQMMRRKVPFASEMSGHYYFKDFFYADSGIFAAIQAINETAQLKAHGFLLNDWLDSLPNYYRIAETNFRVSNKTVVMNRLEKYFQISARQISHLDGLKMEFGEGQNAWWFSVRPSNTEDVLRLNLEAKLSKTLATQLTRIRNLIVN